MRRDGEYYGARIPLGGEKLGNGLVGAVVHEDEFDGATALIQGARYSLDQPAPARFPHRHDEAN